MVLLNSPDDEVHDKIEAIKWDAFDSSRGEKREIERTLKAQ